MRNNFLLMLIAVAFLFWGNINSAIAQCDIVIDMEDSYGDGWNGASVKVYDGTNLLGTATFGAISNVVRFKSVPAEEQTLVKTKNSPGSGASVGSHS